MRHLKCSFVINVVNFSRLLLLLLSPQGVLVQPRREKYSWTTSKFFSRISLFSFSEVCARQRFCRIDTNFSSCSIRFYFRGSLYLMKTSTVVSPNMCLANTPVIAN